MRINLPISAVALAILLVRAPSVADAQWVYPWPTYPESHLRIQVTPKEASVYVDGFLAGTVDEFNGALERLHVLPGQHEIVLYLEGHRSMKVRVYLGPGVTRRIKGELMPLSPGEPEEPLPEPPTDFAPPTEQPTAVPPYPEPRRVPPHGRPPLPGPDDRPLPPEPPPPRETARPSAEPSRFGTLAIQVLPAGSRTVVRVDGEPQEGPAGKDERLIVQVPGGHHTVQAERDGFQPYSKEFDVEAGDTVPVSIVLKRR